MKKAIILPIPVFLSFMGELSFNKAVLPKTFISRKQYFCDIREIFHIFQHENEHKFLTYNAKWQISGERPGTQRCELYLWYEIYIWYSFR